MSASTAPRQQYRTAVRDLPPFERIELRDPASWVDLVAEPGDRHVIEIEAPPELLARIQTRVEAGTLRIALAATLSEMLRDAFTTSLTRQHVGYRIRAPRLLEVRVAGRARVAVHAYGANAPVVTRLEPVPPTRPNPPV